MATVSAIISNKQLTADASFPPYKKHVLTNQIIMKTTCKCVYQTIQAIFCIDEEEELKKHFDQRIVTFIYQLSVANKILLFDRFICWLKRCVFSRRQQCISECK